MSASVPAGAPAPFGRRLLAERAARLASRPHLDAAIKLRSVCVCDTGEALYGVPVEQLARVMPYAAASPLANAPANLLGIISRGGGFALVYDLAGLLGETPQDRTRPGHLILLRKARPLSGLRVERTLAVTDIPLLESEEAASLPVRANVIAHGRADDGRIVSIIDAEALIEAAARTDTGG